MTKPKTHATCPTCRTEFRKVRSHEVYCSVKCQLEPRISREDEGGCWVWTGAKNDAGYGQIRLNGAAKYVHRLMFELSGQIIGEGLHLCHKCDNPACCNPAHLFQGTAKENLADMRAKGRWKPTPSLGEAHGCAKLTAVEVRLIRQLCEDKVSQYEIAKRFGISQSSVHAIKTRLNWASVT